MPSHFYLWERKQSRAVIISLEVEEHLFVLVAWTSWKLYNWKTKKKRRNYPAKIVDRVNIWKSGSFSLLNFGWIWKVLENLAPDAIFQADIINNYFCPVGLTEKSENCVYYVRIINLLSRLKLQEWLFLECSGLKRCN